jgi:gamma-glutamylcyclotransferase (GGCT)/AIG2-like uncharacterized protein YtfP
MGLNPCTVIKESQFLGHGFVRAFLHDSGALPQLMTGSGMVYGELYEIDNHKLKILDNTLKYYSQDPKGSLQVRRTVNVKLFHNGFFEKADAYFYNQGFKKNTLIECGDYRRHLLEKEDMQWYIAYGSNMSSLRLEKRIGKACKIKKGYLKGYKLIFNKRADTVSAYANISYAGSDSYCPFAAYKIKKEQLYELDKYEGEPSQYVRIGFVFSDMNEKSLCMGQIYIANTKELVQEKNPSPWYLKHIFQGYQEHGFDTALLP